MKARRHHVSHLGAVQGGWEWGEGVWCVGRVRTGGKEQVHCHHIEHLGAWRGWVGARGEGRVTQILSSPSCHLLSQQAGVSVHSL